MTRLGSPTRIGAGGADSRAAAAGAVSGARSPGRGARWGWAACFSRRKATQPLCASSLRSLQSRACPSCTTALVALHPDPGPPPAQTPPTCRVLTRPPPETPTFRDASRRLRRSHARCRSRHPPPPGVPRVHLDTLPTPAPAPALGPGPLLRPVHLVAAARPPACPLAASPPARPVPPSAPPRLARVSARTRPARPKADQLKAPASASILRV